MKSKTQIGGNDPAFSPYVQANQSLGRSITSLGDLDGDGVTDIAVGAQTYTGTYTDEGRVYVLFLNANGTVKAVQPIGENTGGFGAQLENFSGFGAGVANIGDLDDDGVTDLAIGAFQQSLNGVRTGAIWINFMNTDGTISSSKRIGDGTNGFGGSLQDGDRFGGYMAGYTDLNGDGNIELAVASHLDDLGATDAGAIYVLYLDDAGNVTSTRKFGATTLGLQTHIGASDYFGSGLAATEDLDNNGIPDLAVGAFGDDDGGANTGAVWFLSLNSSGNLATVHKLAESQPEFTGHLSDNDYFSWAITEADFDNDGTAELVVGARQDDTGGANKGALYVISTPASLVARTEGPVVETPIAAQASWMNEGKEVLMYPNPTQGSNLTLRWADQSMGETRVAIVDMQGKQMLSQFFTDSTVTLDVQALQPGLYLVQIIRDGRSQSLNFMKQ